jgi:hypothetical protein
MYLEVVRHVDCYVPRGGGAPGLICTWRWFGTWTDMYLEVVGHVD